MIVNLPNTAHGKMDECQSKNFISESESNFSDLLNYYNFASIEQKRILNNIFSYDDLNKMLDISYTHNVHGFRSPYQYGHTEQEDTMWIFGDSITFGHGVKYEHTWSYLLSQKLGYKLYNFAVNGRGIDTTIRLAEEWLKNSTNLPKLVISYGYYRSRFEFPILEISDPTPFKRYDTYVSMQVDEENCPMYQKKMEYLNSLFSSYGVKFYNLDFLSRRHGWHNFYVDIARDIPSNVLPILKHMKDVKFTIDNLKAISKIPHPGPKSHDLICNHIYNVIENDK